MKKTCVTCNELKNIEEFSFRTDTQKYRNQCKECVAQNKKITGKKYREENKDKLKEYRKNNKEHIDKKNKEYYQKNQEKIKDQNMEYYYNNKEQVLKYRKKYYYNNLEKSHEANRKWREKNYDKAIKNTKLYYENNKEYLCKKRREQRANNPQIDREREKLYREKNRDRYRYTCLNCGKEFTDFKLGRKFCNSECSSKYYSGENNPNYNRDLTDEERFENRDYTEYLHWRKEVYKRDYYTCQCCGKHSGNLNAHHLNGYNWDKDHRTDVNNGVTLCDACHKQFHYIYGYGNNTKQEYELFSLGMKIIQKALA